MSVKIMGLVWDLDNEHIDREEKYVLLAYTDHADHAGANIFPSINLICQKTGYKERAAQMITRSLVEKGFLVPDGKGPHGTNKWRYGGGAKNAGVQNIPEGGAKPKGKGVQPNAPDPSEPPVLEPSVKKAAKTPPPPEVALYREVTEAFPNKIAFDVVVSAIQKVSARLGRPCTKDDLLPYFQTWMTKSNNKYNFSAWLLEWAVAGKITNGVNNANRTPTPSNRSTPVDDENARRTAERIRARRALAHV